MYGVHKGKVGFGNTREVLLIGPYHICTDDRHECVLTIEVMCSYDGNVKTIGES